MRWLFPLVLTLACACSRNDLDPAGPSATIDAACAGQCDLLQRSWSAGASNEVVLENTSSFLCANHLMDTTGELQPLTAIDFTPQGNCERELFDFDGPDPLSGWTVDRWSLAPGLDGSGVQNDAIGDNESASLSRSFAGPGWLEFWADVSSEGCCDVLTVTSDTGAFVQLGGEHRWSTSGVPIPLGNHVVDFTYSKDGGAIHGLDRVVVDSLALLESSPLGAWRTSGCPFVIDEAEGALRAATCGRTLQKTDPPLLRPSSVELDVFGPSQLEFDWRPSSEADSDYLRLSIDDVVQTEVSGVDVDWAHVEQTISAGLHTVRFYYTKDNGTDDGDDTGWIDNLEITDHCFSGAELTSQWVDAGAPVTVDGVWWEMTSPSDTDANIHVRTAPSPSAAEATPWGSCRPTEWGRAPDPLCAPLARFVQYHVELTCAPYAEPPSLRAVGIRWR